MSHADPGTTTAAVDVPLSEREWHRAAGLDDLAEGRVRPVTH